MTPACGHPEPIDDLRRCDNCAARALGFWYECTSDYWDQSYRRDGFHGCDLSADRKGDRWVSSCASRMR